MNALKKIALAVLRFLQEYVRGFYPFVICFLATLVFHVLADKNQLIAFIIAGFSFVWALDLASARAEAKARSETAAKFTAFLTTGGETEIAVTINHVTTER